jgi:hypothetical protein
VVLLDRVDDPLRRAGAKDRGAVPGAVALRIDDRAVRADFRRNDVKPRVVVAHARGEEVRNHALVPHFHTDGVRNHIVVPDFHGDGVRNHVVVPDFHGDGVRNQTAVPDFHDDGVRNQTAVPDSDAAKEGPRGVEQSAERGFLFENGIKSGRGAGGGRGIAVRGGACGVGDVAQDRRR